MSVTWYSDTPPPSVPPTGLAWGLVVARFALILPILAVGMAILIPLRAVEARFTGPRRPLTGAIPMWVSRVVLVLMGIRRSVEGTPSRAPLIVANHIGWLDIFTVNSTGPIFFVAKAEVAGWLGISWLAKATGTVFIARDPRQSKAQAEMLGTRMAAGHRLVLFPEGTSTDGRRVRKFRTAMFGALGPEIEVQPVSVIYEAPKGQDPRFYGWWGDMDMAPHLLQVLGSWRSGRVRVVFHPPLSVAAYKDRKVLAQAAEDLVRRGVETRLR